ncbi:SGNH/GDSL hydrolase family protein [uncultured Rubinisphaera sp.]|uniref:SGNH/GDSL hydrolase family protein n=1 Tax=uncultured Rubinisphaera sp. TaxID=1678686 RepID=UPI0030DC28AE
MTQESSSEHESTERKPVRSSFRKRLLILLVFGGILVSCVVFYVFFWLTHPIGSGPAGPDVNREAFEEVWSEQEVVLLGFGDSITAGFGASPGKSFFKMLVNNPDDDFEDVQGLTLSEVLPNLEVNNLALSGSTSIEQVDVLLPKIEEHPEEVFGIIVATIGGNDVIHMYGRTPPREGAMYGATIEVAQPWIDNFEERLDLILDEIGSRFPGGYHIFLANIYDPTDGIGDVQNAGLPAWVDGLQVLGAYNTIIEETCEKREDTTLIDIHSEFIGHGIHSTQFWRSFYHADDPGYWYYDNLEDPNDRGYDAIRRLTLNKMAEVLPRKLKINAGKVPAILAQ